MAQVLYKFKKGLLVSNPYCVTEKSLDNDTVETINSLEFGNQTIDGAWRIRIDSDFLKIERRELGIFVVKTEFEATSGGENSNQDDSEPGKIFEDTVNGTKFRFVIRTDSEYFSIQKFVSPNWEYFYEMQPNSSPNDCRQWRITTIGDNLVFQYQNDGVNWNTELEVTP